MIWISTVCSPALNPDRSRSARTEFSSAVSKSQTERGARRVTSTTGGISLVSTSEESCPSTSSGIGLGKALTSSGSAALTADTQTEIPRASARINVRRFFANKRMLIILGEKEREISLKQDTLRCCVIRTEERSQDILEPLRINAADHAPSMGNRYGAALF